MQSTTDQNDQVTSPVVMWVLLFVSSLTVMAGATIAPSLPAMQEQFSETQNAELLVRLVLTIPALFILTCGPIAGVLIDRIGRKPVLLSSVILYGLAGGSGLVLSNLYAILAGRALLGVAVAGIMTTATALISDYYSGQDRSKVLGSQAGFMGFGGVVFLSFGGLLAGIDWRGPFVVYLFALVLAPLVLLVLYEPDRAGSSTQPETASGNQQQVPWGMLSLVYALGFIGMLVFYTVPTQLPFYLGNLTGAGPTVTGLAIALSTLVGGIVSLYFSKVNARLGYVSIAVITFAFLGFGFGAIGLAGGYPLLLFGLALGGVGTGLLMPVVNTWISSGTPEAIKGRALGGVTTAIYLGQFLSPVVSQPVGGTLGFGTLYVLAGGLALTVAVFVALFLSSAKTKTKLEQPSDAATSTATG